jgi:hypothetical protein
VKKWSAEKRIMDVFLLALGMKRSTLIFPNSDKLFEFIISLDAASSETDSRSCTLTAWLTDQQIASACTQFGAHLVSTSSIPEHSISHIF